MIEIIWTKIAKNDYWKNIAYLEKEWALKDVYNFIDKTDVLIEKLSWQNIVFKPTSYRDVFHVPVTKQITLYYKVLKNQYTV